MLRALFRRGPRWLLYLTALVSVVAIPVGAMLIKAAIDRPTETVSAHVSASPTAVRGGGGAIDFQFADGSGDVEETVDIEDDLFIAVERHGPGPARVTRNTASDTIYKVRFRGKTYELASPVDDIAAGVLAIVVGLLGVVYVIRRRDGLRGAR